MSYYSKEGAKDAPAPFACSEAKLSLNLLLDITLRVEKQDNVGWLMANNVRTGFLPAGVLDMKE